MREAVFRPYARLGSVGCTGTFLKGVIYKKLPKLEFSGKTIRGSITADSC